MGLRSKPDVGSPLQNHPVNLANSVMWISGVLETLGDPHNYINQEGLDFFLIKEPHIAPWVFTGLPASRVAQATAVREHIQMLILSGESAMEQFRKSPRTEPIILNLPLVVIRGEVPFLSDAKFGNFLDFWKGLFFPVIDAEIHYLTDGPADLPTQPKVAYVNRHLIQNYLPG